ncbi:MAG: ATP-binding cassette domain-containing protein [Acidimicrobiales bacterium]|jgi:signal transduction histidine kinase/ABC-type multidrug transport system ATPase subunit
MVTALVQVPSTGAELAPPLLSVRGLYVTYSDLRVLNGVDFEVWPGQLVALTGENGAGKSTLVRCIAGDISPNVGEVLIGGSPVRSNAGAAHSGLAVVWQDLALCDNLDVAANLFLGRERGRWLVSDAKATIATRRVLGSYGIKVSDVRSVGSLSTGQRQLVAVARAMQSHPRLLVLDEPTASLGVKETRQVEELIVKLKAQGTTVLLVSHDVEQVFNLADRILVMHRGRVVADLLPSETHPDDVVAIMSGHPPAATARHQLTRLQNLVDQLALARPSSSLPLIVSALGAALGTQQLCIHLLEDQCLRLVAAEGLPPELVDAWASVPVGPGGGPMGTAAAGGRVVIEEDLDKSPTWWHFSAMVRRAGIRSSWSVPLVASSGLIGVITGCQPFVGRPHRDQMDLVSLYAGYAAGAIERDRLFGEVTARNRVLETIREVLETLAGPEPVSSGLLLALQSLQRGLRATEIELWVTSRGGRPRCTAFIDGDNQAHRDLPQHDATDAARAFAAPPHFGGPRHWGRGGTDQVIATTFESPDGRAALIARWLASEVPDDALALLGDAANSVRLALERAEAEQAHQQAAALRRSHQLQRDFLSRLSHELRTPLTAIRGYASSLLASDVTWDDESKMRFLSRIAGESSRLGRLVGDLLDFSAIESGLLRLQQDWCDLSLVIAAAVSCLHPEGAEGVVVCCPPEIGPVWADHDRLEQVFVNLLDNALGHNPPGVSVRIEVAVAGTDSVAIRVSDDGRGIPRELKEQLFESWARGATSAPRAGLGLSIARGIVVAHGGQISLDDTRQGASFMIVLPLEGPGETVA